MMFLLGTVKFSLEPITEILIEVVIGSLVILVTWFILSRKKCAIHNPCSSRTGMEVNRITHRKSNDGIGLVFFGKGEKEFEMDQLFASQAEVLGKGTFGCTYKANLEGKDALVIKRLKTRPRAFGKEKIDDLGGMVHENLLPLKAYYHGEDETLLISDFMPMGSLSRFLQGRTSISLNWHVRRKIAYGVARGIEYLHSQGPNVCHGNLRSSNIFLTNSFDARVSEFGIAQLLPAESKLNCIAVYRAPELANANNTVSQKADVYSFGVVLLELLTGKPPKHGVSEDLPKWVISMFQEKPIIDVFDQKLLTNQDMEIEEQMFLILQLAICCTFQYPKNRPSIAVVANRIRDICYSGSS